MAIPIARVQACGHFHVPGVMEARDGPPRPECAGPAGSDAEGCSGRLLENRLRGGEPPSASTLEALRDAVLETVRNATRVAPKGTTRLQPKRFYPERAADTRSGPRT